MTSTTSNPSKHYCVWFITCAKSASLGMRRNSQQVFQDLMVVEAINEEHAVEIAAKLLRKRCALDAAITKVIDRAELVRVLSVLDRVDRGDLLPATIDDLDHYVWEERYLVHNSPLIPPAAAN